MPTYQYRCRQCGEEFEKVQSFSDDSTPKCPGCGTRSKKNVAKVFGAVGITFKGSGFYKNDHGGKKSSVTASDSGSQDSSSSDSSSSKTSESSGDSSTKKSEASSTSSTD
ncbi:MAG: zinc ribbon domain-containing protein [Acidimicrobiales bacterium]|nr:zinc ribbon domain-containing protein [Acidimicrobiales bacterium]RZV48074.1 MAG: zinc ribbon domain-containing protein [Acidimicrobiales bacterium]